ncbi:hypothetical protein FOZ63_019737, partial [Perkinsus olseni]
RDSPHVQVGVVCRKGRKGNEDHTPNQDSFSITLLDDNTVVGLVCDGHGPFGHLISQRSTQSAANLVCQRLRGADSTTGASGGPRCFIFADDITQRLPASRPS